MANEKYFVILDTEEEAPQSAEEKAAAKASRRDLYICAKLSAQQHTKAIEEFEAGLRESIPGTLNDIEWHRQALTSALRNIEKFEAEFTDDPDIERDMEETDRFFTGLGAGPGKKEDQNN